MNSRCTAPAMNFSIAPFPFTQELPMFLTWWRKLALKRMQTAARRKDSRRGTRPRSSNVQIETLEDRNLPSIGSIVVPQTVQWIEQGPGPITGGTAKGMINQNNPVVGAIQAIAVH